MAIQNDASMICLSANGKTISSSKVAPKKLLVATADGISEFARSEANEQWSLERDDILKGHHPSALLLEPRSGLLFAGLHFEGGVQVSSDGGRTWSPRNNGLQSEHVYTLHVQYVGDKTVLYAGTEPVMVYRSDDLGKSWHAMPAILDVPDTDKWLFPRSVPHVKNIAADPERPDTIYACVEQGDLLKTTDGGKTWQPLASMEKADDKFRRDMHRATFFPTNSNEIFLTTGIGLYHTTDGGKTWERLTDTNFRIGYPDPFFIDPADNKIMFMAGAGISPNPNWGKEGTAHPLFLRSTDFGRTWSDAMNGVKLPVRGNIEAAAMHKSDECLEFVMGTACGELYASTDAAKSWKLVTDQLPAVSKGPHFRHFLPPEQRMEYENRLRAMNAFA